MFALENDWYVQSNLTCLLTVLLCEICVSARLTSYRPRTGKTLDQVSKDPGLDGRLFLVAVSPQVCAPLVLIHGVLHLTSFFRGYHHGPPGVRAISSRLKNRLTPWQTMVITLLWLYISRNFAKIVGLECPEPLANLYSRSYFRATWITTALDAGFWTAMKIRPAWLRDIASIVFSIYYLFAAEQADEKVRRVRATLTVEHLRVSWNKATTPYLAAIGKLLRPRFTRYPPRAIRIPRPRESSYREPVSAWLYFDGPLSALRDETCIVLDIPGGGFVAMNPRTADDKLLAWAGKTGVPILSLDYRKAPEYPYPYALNECYDVYRTIVASRGRCVGLSGKVRPHVVITGDSAGGNLAAGLTIMILQSGSTETRQWHGETALPPPDGLVLVYPSLDMNIGSWMTEEQMALFQDRGMRKTNENVLRRKSEDYYRLTPTGSRCRLSPDETQDNNTSLDYFNHKESGTVDTALKTSDLATQAATVADNQPRQIKTRLAVSSMISYFNDRILTPEMMRAMIILYIGPHNRPDFSTDFLLSPVLAPEAVLARFPKTYILTGERDPLVDDTVIFAGRIRQAKLHRFRERQELGLEKSTRQFNEKEYVEVDLIPSISHGFLNFPGIFPEAWKHIHKCAVWIHELFERAEQKKSATSSLVHSTDSRLITESQASKRGHSSSSRRSSFAESSADEDRPLEMRSIRKFTPVRPPSVTTTTTNGSATTDGYATAEETATAPKANEPANSTQEVRLGNKTPKRGGKTLRGGGGGGGKTRHRKPAAADNIMEENNNDINLDEDDEHDEEDEYPTTTPKKRKEKQNGSSGGGPISRLPTEEDLIGRRMNGLAGGLMGLGEGVRTP